MPELCSKLAYNAGIMLNALACLLCLKLCRHNRRRPSAVFLFLTYYAHERTYASFCTKSSLDYYNYHKSFYKDCFKIPPIMLALCLMLSETYYAQTYASIIGLGLHGSALCNTSTQRVVGLAKFSVINY